MRIGLGNEYFGSRESERSDRDCADWTYFVSRELRECAFALRISGSGPHGIGVG